MSQPPVLIGADTTPRSQPPAHAFLDPELVASAVRLRDDAERMLMEHRFAVEEILTKVNILREEFLHLHNYNPIEHVGSRVKTMESILNKAVRKGCEPTIECIREHIFDIAGVRITCSFIADTYEILRALASQNDVRVLEIKDYIKNPKASGYKSLHAIIEIPVFLSTGPVPVNVEVQIRTIAMDFWASLEHKIFYKYRGEVPPHLAGELRDAAATAAQLDARMERLHAEVQGSARDDDAKSMDSTTVQQMVQFFRSTKTADSVHPH
ncbi:MAG: GTP pyrophosphokinase family protein [Propionibacteriaceae bacterium]|nr:GTP pyrophosphokinase family protein [Propionibacteriaceae bacterium]